MMVILLVVVAPVIVLVVILGRRNQGPSLTPAPLYSPDGRWWWNGREWQPVQPPHHQSSEAPTPPTSDH